MGNSASAIGITGLVLQAGAATANILQGEARRTAAEKQRNENIARADAEIAKADEQQKKADDQFAQFEADEQAAADKAIQLEAEAKNSDKAQSERDVQKSRQRQKGRSGTILTGPGGIEEEDEEKAKTLLG